MSWEAEGSLGFCRDRKTEIKGAEARGGKRAPVGINHFSFFVRRLKHLKHQRGYIRQQEKLTLSEAERNHTVALKLEQYIGYSIPDTPYQGMV